MSGRKREGISPTLFPFLAVLICTLGTLILMLAILARDGDKASAETVEAEPNKDAEVEARELAEADTEIDLRLTEAQWQRDKVGGAATCGMLGTFIGNWSCWLASVSVGSCCDDSRGIALDFRPGSPVPRSRSNRYC